MKRYTRSQIIYHEEEEVHTTPENLHKYTCQVFLNVLHPESLKEMMERDDGKRDPTYVDYLVADSIEELIEMYEEKYGKEE